MDSNEFKLKKEDVVNKIDDLLKSYDELSKITSPQHWRTTGHHAMELQKMKGELEHTTEITKDELDTEWVQQALKQV